MSSLLQNKVVIVTGSTTGIGEAIARRAVDEGGKVLIHGRDRTAGEAVVKSLAPHAALHIDDLTDPASANRIVDAAIDAFGKIDAVCNNAGWSARATLEQSDADLFDRVMALNVRAPMLLIRAAMPHLIQSHGAVVNIGSINQFAGEANLMIYSMSKAALLTLSRNLADSYGQKKVRVNHFVVGWVISENERKLQIKNGLPVDWHEHPDPHFVPSGKMTTPDDIARHAVFWLGDASRPFSGGVIELEQHPMVLRNPQKGA